jgi:cholesterol transport system auxiliary component
VWLLGAVSVVLALGGCGSLLPKPTPQPAYFALNSAALVAPAASAALATSKASAASAASEAPEVSRLSMVSRTSLVSIASAASKKPLQPVLVVLQAKAAPGFDSARIIYTRQAHRLEYFARSEWVDTPARMLTPLIVAALDRAGSFGAVVMAPSVATGGVLLDIQMLRLQQEFNTSPSQARLALRAQLIDSGTQRVLATRDFERTEASATEDAAGGVAASQGAVRAVLADLVSWCGAVVAGSR